VQEALKQHGPDIHLVIASSGNAALALAHVCQTLHVKCTVFLPNEAAKKNMLDTLDRLGANLVVVPGEYYADALVKAKEFVATDKNM
jgi:L-serine/L-threonine ammonia-lyase